MKLFAHQEEGIRFILSNNGNGALFWEMGCGKTIAAIMAFKALREKTPNLNLIVIAPLSLLRAAWALDAAKVDPKLKVYNLHDKDTISNDYDILVLNFESLLGAKKMLLLNGELKKYPFMAAIDESSRMKNFKSKTAKSILSLSSKFKHRIIMSGLPAPNNAMEYWAQCEFVKPGIFFGNFFKFRNTYFHLERGNHVQQGQFMTRHQAREIFSQGWKYAITPANQQKLMAIIAPICDRRKKEDCLDLPDQVDEIREIELSPGQRKIYKQMKNELITEINCKMITAPVALTKYMKLREICSGFAIDAAGMAHTIPGSNGKLDELMDVIEEAKGDQAIIWANFTWEINTIAKLLSEKDTTAALHGDTKDRDQVIQDFIDGKIKYLVAHPKSAAHGLTLVNASLQIFFSLDYSFESYEQARARTHRAGQKRTCVYVHLISKDTLEEDILKVLKRKGNSQELLWGLK